VPDVLPGCWQRAIPLGPDPDGEGDIVATLVRRGQPATAAHAVLAVYLCRVADTGIAVSAGDG
jgi:hypothetical protein